jgi:hypothetical protein
MYTIYVEKSWQKHSHKTLYCNHLPQGAVIIPRTGSYI